VLLEPRQQSSADLLFDKELSSNFSIEFNASVTTAMPLNTRHLYRGKIDVFCVDDSNSMKESAIDGFTDCFLKFISECSGKVITPLRWAVECLVLSSCWPIVNVHSEPRMTSQVISVRRLASKESAL